jgi:hypothetical protein
MVSNDNQLITFEDKSGHGRFQYGSIYREPQPVDGFEFRNVAGWAAGG